MGGEFPEPIIQRIQSLLTTKEAARTSIVSKSWHGAWSTRPNLVFDERDFKDKTYSRDLYATSQFSKYATKTIKRYQQSNLKIESLKLCISVFCNSNAALVNKLIVKALTKLGATRLHLQHYNISYVLPHEVFAAENLVQLSIKACKITLDYGMVVKCRRLESLSLDYVDVASDVLSHIISSCPSIENLSLSRIYDHNPRTLPDPTCPFVGNRLKCLVLSCQAIRSFFPGDSLSRFPFLTDLTLKVENWFTGGGFLQISNSSLRHVKIETEIAQGGSQNHRRPELQIGLDVPSIRKFSFAGDVIPKLFFSSACAGEWESHVSIAARFGAAKERTPYGDGGGGPTGLTVSWFHELFHLLTELRRVQSKINLSLGVECSAGIDYRVGDMDMRAPCKHEVESLAIDMTGLPSFNCYAILDGLFRLCRPKLITQNHQGTSKNRVLLWHALEQGMHVWNPRQLMYGLSGLEEVNAQVFDDDGMRWGPPIPLESLLLLQEQDQQQEQRVVRLLLIWKPSE